MKWTDDKLDNLYREASENINVDFNDAYWVEMEAMLNQAKPTKKRFIYWWYSLFALVLFFLGAFAYHYFEKNNLNKNLDTLKNNAIAENNPKNLNKEMQKEILGFDSVKLKISNVDGNSFPNENLNATVDKVIINKQNNVKVSFVIGSDTKSTMEKGDGLTSEKIIDQTNELNKNEPKINPIKSQENIKEEKQLINPEKENKLLDIKHKIKQLESYESIEVSAKVSKDDDLPIDKNNLLGETKNDNFETSSMSPSLNPVFNKKWMYYISAGIGAGATYTQNTSSILNQWGIHTGVEYNVLKNIKVGLGVGFRQQILDDLMFQRNRVLFSYGAINFNQLIKYDRLQFVDLKMHVLYELNKFGFGLEFTPNYLVGVRSNSQQIYKGDFLESTKIESQKEFVRTEKLNAFGINLGVNIQYQLKKHLNFNVGLHTRLNQFMLGDGWIGEERKLPMYVECGLIKRF